MKKNSFTVLTAFPELIQPYLQDGILSKACKNNLLLLDFVSLRDFSMNKYKSIDDAPFGGSDGMLITCEVLERALQSVSDWQKKKIVYLTPQGKLWNASLASEWAKQNEEIILISGRYAGIDQRFINQYVDEEISIGDFVLSGGELAAMVLIESTARFIPGVLGDATSVDKDSHQNGLLEAPQFTRPQSWNSMEIPSILTSGHHAKIKEWQENVSILVTFKKRPELLKNLEIDWNRLKEFYHTLSDKDLITLDLKDIKFPYE